MNSEGRTIEAQALTTTGAYDKSLAMQEDSWSIDQVVQQVEKIQKLLGRVMKQGEHFGTIPGCGDKMALFKSGAEKIALTFQLIVPPPNITVKELPNGHREYMVTCDLIHKPSQRLCGSGVGICSTMETKYRYREGRRKCTSCGSEAIIKGKAAYGGGWLCFAKKGGCGAKFKDGDNSIEGQQAGRAENPDIADTYNTVLKMAKKRAFVDAILSTTAASDIFTQDIEDNVEPDVDTTGAKPAKRAPAMPREKDESPATESVPSGVTDDQRRAFITRAKEVLGNTCEDAVKRYMKMKFNKENTRDLLKFELQALEAWLEELAANQVSGQ